MKHFFGFMDETGVLSNDPNQRFFALGLLKLEDTSLFYEDLKKIRDNAINATGKKDYEFKFAGTTKNNIFHSKKLIDYCLNNPKFYFSAVLLDKAHKDLDLSSVYTSTWEAQISFAKTLVKNNSNGDKISILADYLTKPNNSEKYFENELRKVESVDNACMLESNASLFIQVVDIFIGSIIYRYKIDCGLAPEDTAKADLSFYLEERLKETSLCNGFKNSLMGNFTINRPFYFSLWEFKPQKVRKF
ncbi:MAG: DUF3800 domain-containing protein [Campylobacterales bacterium]|nr:DUF3800 domain-containing protein [Campylobacterales bacterium]